MTEKIEKLPLMLKLKNRAEENRISRVKAPAEKAEVTPAAIFAIVLMSVLAFLSLVPLIWLVRTALVPQADALELYKLSVPTLENLKRILDAAPFDTYYINTIIMVVATLLVQFVSVTMAGYAFARINFIGKNIIFMLFLTQMMISPDVLIMPNYRFLSSLKLADTKLGVILPFFVSAMGILMMRQTIKTIPYELEEAAKIDGCSVFQIIKNIYIPLLKPVYISFGLISASYQWNNFLWPLVMINSEKNRPLTLGLAIFAMAAETGANWSDVCAATLIVVLPLLMIFIIFQKQFVESFASSGIK